MGERRRRGAFLSLVLSLGLLLLLCEGTKRTRKNAYATMMYMGTPRDYEFYIATRVMLRSLAKLQVDADLVVIASMDVPPHWIQALQSGGNHAGRLGWIHVLSNIMPSIPRNSYTLEKYFTIKLLVNHFLPSKGEDVKFSVKEEEDGAKVMKVENVKNPYVRDQNSGWRFTKTLNKLYVWKLVEYERVVMLDADNLFLQKTDELFQCGQFCAVFINPCIFHTGLFVLQPSLELFNDMIHEVEIGRSNTDGADQGFIGSYFPDLLDRPMFHPPSNTTTLDGTYRLPLGYQMDASYYYLKLRWSVPCGPNSVITFPGAPWLKPWYWWSWPVLPLGIQWHERRLQTLGYAAETPIVFIQVIFYLGVMAVARLARPNLSKLCYRREEKSVFLPQTGFKLIALWSILAAYIVPFFLVPHTVHPVIGWGLYLLGAFSLSFMAINAFLLPMLHVLVPWFGIIGALLVMAYPWYNNGVSRALAVFGYAFCSSPFLWVSLVKIVSSLQVSLEREAFLPRFGENASPLGFNKLY